MERWAEVKLEGFGVQKGRSLNGSGPEEPVWQTLFAPKVEAV